MIRCVGCFGAPLTKEEEEVVETATVSRGVHVCDAGARLEGESFPEHLLITVNGLVGRLALSFLEVLDCNLQGRWFMLNKPCIADRSSANDWKYAAEQFVKEFPDKIVVHRSECNYSKLTFDGVDLMGERLADEVLSVINHRKGLRKISFLAHSLGGLIARYAIGRLYKPAELVKDVTSNGLVMDQYLQGKVAGLESMNFITFATPHLGSRGNKQLPLLCGLPFLERNASQAAHFFAGNTGRHLFLTDIDDGKPPLLLRMVSDCDYLKFRSALGSFKRRVTYANKNFDSMVGWRTSSIRRQHELPKSRLLVKDKKYPHIVYVDTRGNTQMTVEKEPSSNDLEEEMIKGLTQVPWERVDVSFQRSTQRYVAHSTIQVKSDWLNSEGADVVFHMIHNFLV